MFDKAKWAKLRRRWERRGGKRRRRRRREGKRRRTGGAGQGLEHQTERFSHRLLDRRPQGESLSHVKPSRREERPSGGWTHRAAALRFYSERAWPLP